MADQNPTETLRRLEKAIALTDAICAADITSEMLRQAGPSFWIDVASDVCVNKPSITTQTLVIQMVAARERARTRFSKIKVEHTS